MKTERMSFSEFLTLKEPDPFKVKFQKHMDKYGIIYKIVGSTVVLFVAGGGLDMAFANSPDVAVASTGIEKGASKMYYELVRIGKWIVIFKGGFDIIKSAGNGDTETIKKSFISYLLIYLLLLGLPFGFDKIDQLFNEMKNV
jgi:hypothetical protein